MPLLGSLTLWPNRARNGNLYLCAMHGCTLTRFLALVTENFIIVQCTVVPQRVASSLLRKILSSLLCTPLTVVVASDKVLRDVFDEFPCVLVWRVTIQTPSILGSSIIWRSTTSSLTAYSLASPSCALCCFLHPSVFGPSSEQAGNVGVSEGDNSLPVFARVTLSMDSTL